MTDIPEPDWENAPWPESYESAMKVVHPASTPFVARHIGRLPDTTPQDLVAQITAERDGVIKAIRLPWWKLDKSVGFGLRPGNVSIVTGIPGGSKSYFVLNILLAAGRDGFSWRLLPLEDDAATWVLKALAVHTNDWRLISQPEHESRRQELGDYKLEQLARHHEFVADMYQNIAENPRMPISRSDGGKVVLDVKYQDVLRFIEDESECSDVIAVDPISQVTFDPDGKDFRGQADFMRRLVAIAASTKSHVLLVAHNAKQQYRGTSDSVDGIMGSAMFGRLAHNVLTINKHDPAIEDKLYSHFTQTVTHRLTVSVTKSRSGMTGDRFAFDLDANGPTFKEHGMIKFEPVKRVGRS